MGDCAGSTARGLQPNSTGVIEAGCTAACQTALEIGVDGDARHHDPSRRAERLPRFAATDAPAILVEHEAETDRGWRYDIRLTASASASRLEVSLAWVDHEYWCGGTKSPSRVIEAVIEALLDCVNADELPSRFDAATVRRWCPGIDADVRRRL